jgi:hypothetical protein
MSTLTEPKSKQRSTFGHTEWEHAKQQLSEAGYRVIERLIEPAPNYSGGSGFWTAVAAPPSWWPRKNDCCGTGSTKFEAGKDLFEKRLAVDKNLRRIMRASPKPNCSMRLAGSTVGEGKRVPRYYRDPWTGTPLS